MSAISRFRASTTSAQAPAAPGRCMRWLIWPSLPTSSATRAISAALASSSSTTSLNACAISPSMPVRCRGMRTEKSPRLNARSAFSSSARSSISCRPGIDSMQCAPRGAVLLSESADRRADAYGGISGNVSNRCRCLDYKSGGRYGISGSIHQVVGDGVVHELRVRLHVHLAEDAGAVGADRVGAEEELVGDLAHGLAGGDHPHDLVLAVRERLVQRLAAVVLELEGELLAEGRGDVAPPAGHLADGAHQLVGGRLLGEVARGTRLQGPHR